MNQLEKLKKENKELRKILSRRGTATFCNKCKQIIPTIESSLEVFETTPEKVNGYGYIRRRHKLTSYHKRCWRSIGD